MLVPAVVSKAVLVPAVVVAPAVVVVVDSKAVLVAAVAVVVVSKAVPAPEVTVAASAAGLARTVTSAEKPTISVRFPPILPILLAVSLRVTSQGRM